MCQRSVGGLVFESSLEAVRLRDFQRRCMGPRFDSEVLQISDTYCCFRIASEPVMTWSRVLFIARVIVAFLSLAVAAASCGDSPTSPSRQPPLADGMFVLSLLGGTSECGDLKNPQAGTAISVQLRASHSGEVWIGKAATAADGDFEMRLARTTEPVTLPGGFGPLRSGDTSVAGTLQGTATDSYLHTPTFILSGTSAVFGSSVTINGIVRVPPGTFAEGRNTSALTFSRAGVSSTCPASAAGWTLNGPL